MYIFFYLIVKFSEFVDEMYENEDFSGLWCRILFHTIVKQKNSSQVLISFETNGNIAHFSHEIF